MFDVSLVNLIWTNYLRATLTENGVSTLIRQLGSFLNLPIMLTSRSSSGIFVFCVTYTGKQSARLVSAAFPRHRFVRERYDFFHFHVVDGRVPVKCLMRRVRNYWRSCLILFDSVWRTLACARIRIHIVALGRYIYTYMYNIRRICRQWTCCICSGTRNSPVSTTAGCRHSERGFARTPYRPCTSTNSWRRPASTRRSFSRPRRRCARSSPTSIPKTSSPSLTNYRRLD